MTEEEARAKYMYPSGNIRMACPGDNDGYATCLGDTSMCGYSPVLRKQVCVNLAEEGATNG